MKLLILCALLTGCVTTGSQGSGGYHSVFAPTAPTPAPITCTTNAGITQCW